MNKDKLLWLLKTDERYTVIINNRYKELYLVEKEIEEITETYYNTLKSLNINPSLHLLETLVTLSVEKMIGKINKNTMNKKVKSLINSLVA